MGVSDGLGGRIRQARVEQGLELEDLARGDFTPAYLDQVERGGIRPSLEALQLLAERLNRPVSYFLQGDVGSRADVFLLVNLAADYLDKEDANRARPLLEQARQYVVARKDRRVQGLVELACCRLCWLEGRVGEAEKRALRALKLLQEHGGQEEIAQATMYLGNLAWTRRDSYAALARYQDALTLVERSGNTRLLSRAHANLGSAYLLMEDWEAAASHYRTAVNLAELEADAHYRARLQLDLALAYRDQGKLEQALELAKKALHSLDEEKYATIVADLMSLVGSIHALHSDKRRAKEYYERALNILGDREAPQAAEVYRQLVRLDVEQGNMEQACRWAEAALELANRVGDKVERGRCCLVYGQALVSAGRFDEAREHLEAAREVFEAVGMGQSLVVAKDILRHISMTTARTEAQPAP